MSRRCCAVRGFEHRLRHDSPHQPTERSLADHSPARVGVAEHGPSQPDPTLRRRGAASDMAIVAATSISIRVRPRPRPAHTHHRAQHRRSNPHSDVAPTGPAADPVAASSLGAYPTSALRPWHLAAMEHCTGGYRINLNISSRWRPAALGARTRAGPRYVFADTSTTFNSNASPSTNVVAMP